MDCSLDGVDPDVNGDVIRAIVQVGAEGVSPGHGQAGALDPSSEARSVVRQSTPESVRIADGAANPGAN